MHYVYIIKSVTDPSQIYVGHTTDLKKCLANHNSETTYHTEKYKPWELVIYTAFQGEMKAIEFEK